MVGSNNAKFNDPMSVTWLEKYDEKISQFWNKLPKVLKNVIAALTTFLFGVSISGE